MIIASAFTLLKLLNSFFVDFVDANYGRTLFTRTVRSIRNISIASNDLPSRFAEVLSQMWKGSRAATATAPGAKKSVDAPAPTSINNNGNNSIVDDSLQLKVKCRMSMSVVFDSAWRWRDHYQDQGRVCLEAALKNPTNPDSTIESSATSVTDHQPPSTTHTSTSLGVVGGGGHSAGSVPPMSIANNSGNLGAANGALSGMLGNGIGVSGDAGGGGFIGVGDMAYNDVFDPLNWMFDGYVELPPGYGLEGDGGLV